MKDKYVGDVNDYVKYALLRALTAPGALAVCWMRTAPDDRPDGRKLTYLTRPDRYRRLDPALFDCLLDIVTGGDRTVSAIERNGILPGAVHSSELLHDHAAGRPAYFGRFWDMADGREAAFFDPDNGVCVPSVPRGRRGSSKYIYWDELAATYERGHSVIVYQHFPRRPRELFMRELAARLRAAVGCGPMFALMAANVAFLIVPQPAKAHDFSECLIAFSEHVSPLATVLKLES